MGQMSLYHHRETQQKLSNGQPTKLIKVESEGRGRVSITETSELPNSNKVNQNKNDKDRKGGRNGSGRGEDVARQGEGVQCCSTPPLLR